MASSRSAWGSFARLACNMRGHVVPREWADIMPRIDYVHAKFYVDLCVLFLTWPDAGSNLCGIAGTATVRLFVSDVVDNSEDHILAIAIEASDQSDLDTFAPVATEVINSAIWPLTPR